MSFNLARSLFLMLALVLLASPFVSAAEKGGPIAMMLAHAEDWKITPEQKTKLEELNKQVQEKRSAGDKAGAKELMGKLKDILTAEQMTKFESMKPKKKDGEKKPEGEKKEEEKKPEGEKKAEEPKKIEEKKEETK